MTEYQVGQRVRVKNVGGFFKPFNGRGGVITKRIANHVWRVAIDGWRETNLATSEIEPEEDARA